MIGDGDVSLGKYYVHLGLRLSSTISELFAGGIWKEELAWILAYSGITEGSSPVCYLDVPLITGKLLGKECELLAARIMRRIQGWAVPFLASQTGFPSSAVTMLLFSLASEGGEREGELEPAGAKAEM